MYWHFHFVLSKVHIHHSDYLPFTRLLPVLLKRSYASSEAPLVGRILKALLSIITVLLSPVEALSSSKITSNSTPQLASGGTAPGNSKRINENEDVLDGTRVSFHLSTYEREVVLSTLDGSSVPVPGSVVDFNYTVAYRDLLNSHTLFAVYTRSPILSPFTDFARAPRPVVDTPCRTTLRFPSRCLDS